MFVETTVVAFVFVPPLRTLTICNVSFLLPFSFKQSFSSVVGPNGSGKSNVIDAMMFVFGKRAKQLRLNKVSELIHKLPTLEWNAMSKVHFTRL